MPKSTTASVLIESIKRRAAIPENQATFEPADFLAFADEELWLEVVPDVMSMHEDFFLFEIRTPLKTGVLEYEIPSRAMGTKLRDLQYTPDGKTVIEMTRIGIGERFNEFNGGMANDLRRFYVKNNKVVVADTLANVNNGSLIFVIYIKPSSLVLEDRVGIIQGVNDLNNGTTELVLNEVPDNFNTSIIYDLYKAESPSTILTIDIKPVSINSVTKSIIFNSTDISPYLKVGDHVSEAGEATIAQIPTELNAMLAQLVACRVLEAQGDTQGLQNAQAKLKSMQDASQNIIDNRVEDSPTKIVNRHSLLRSRVTRRYNRGY